MDAREILLDPSFTVPSVPPGGSGVRWLRSHVVRFSEGVDHERRRHLAETVLAGIDPTALLRSGDHVSTLAEALGLPRTVAHDIRLVAGSYQPDTTITDATDEAVARLVAACGGAWDEATANRIGLLVQACAAGDRMVAGFLPPVEATRRVGPAGDELVVPLAEMPFGAGRHACPGEAHAIALANGVSRFRRLHEGPAPLVLPNAWDAASASLFARAGFAAVGTTSLGVAAAAGVPDAFGAARAETLQLARSIASLPVPVTIDIESGWYTDHGELADLACELWEMGIAGVNVEDGRGPTLADAAKHAEVVAALKSGAPPLFVNARTDTCWLHVDEESTNDRARRYIDAGADCIFVPGVDDESQIADLAATLPVPLNVLAGITVSRLGELGVRRVSTGSAPYRAALTAALDTAVSVANGSTSPRILGYDEINSLAARPTNGTR